MTDRESLHFRIHDWLETQGYPLEMRLAKAIRRHDALQFRQSWNYEDHETGKSREIDIICTKQDYVGFCEINFIFECKGTTKPWVLFTSEETGSSYHRLSGFGIFSKQAFASAAGALFDFEDPDHTKLKEIPWLWKERHIGYSLVQGFDGNKDAPYSAVMSAVKAALWSKTNSVWQNGEFLSHVVCFPVVVTSSPLFECSLDENGDTVLKEVTHGFLFFNQTIGDFTATCVSIVNEKYIDTFIQECLSVTQKLEKAMEPDLKKLRDNL